MCVRIYLVSEFTRLYPILIIAVNLTVSAEYMLQILAKVNGRYIGSICNYLIVCEGELTDQVLEEVKQLRERKF